MHLLIRRLQRALGSARAVSQHYRSRWRMEIMSAAPQRIGVLRRPLRTLCGSVCVCFVFFFLKALLFIAAPAECCTAVFIGVTFNGGVKAGLASLVSDPKMRMGFFLCRYCTSQKFFSSADVAPRCLKTQHSSPEGSLMRRSSRARAGFRKKQGKLPPRLRDLFPKQLLTHPEALTASLTKDRRARNGFFKFFFPFFCGM